MSERRGDEYVHGSMSSARGAQSRAWRAARRGLATLATLTLTTLATPPGVAQSQATPSILDWPTLTRDAKPWTRWWWLGDAVDSAGIARELDHLAAAGFGGVEITAIYGAKGAEEAYIPYLSPRWSAMVALTSREARRRGMRVDLPQGSGWRMGGPSVGAAHANASLVVSVDTVSAGDVWRARDETVRLDAALAVSDDGRRVRVPLRHGRDGTSWRAPAGRWRIYSAGTRPSGDAVKRPAPGGEGRAIDPFSAAATARYLRTFERRTAEWPPGTIDSYFHDSFEYTGNGSRELFRVFRRLRGYDLASELPALAGEGDADHVARVRSDYRQTLSDMLRERFVERLTRWSHARGALMREQAHGSPGNLLDLYAAADIPETETFGVVGGPDSDPLVEKFASSAAHVAGRRLASAESFTWLGEHFTGTLGDMKRVADQLFLAGVNHLVYHGTAYSPVTAPWPGWQFYASMEINPRNAIWHDLPALNQYVARVSSMMQEGRAEGDVLLYWPVWDEWHDSARRRIDFRVHDPRWLRDAPFGEVASALELGGVATDYVSDRQLARDVSVADGRIRTAGGSYVAIVVPRTAHMPPEIFARLLALAHAGATVVFADSLPADVPGAARLDERRAALSRAKETLGWRAVETGVREAALGSGRVLTGAPFGALIAAAGVKPDPLTANTGLRVLRRRVEDELRWFAVASAAPVDGWVDLAGAPAPAAVALLDPMTGRTGLARTRTRGARTQLYLQIEPGHSLIVRSSPRAQHGPSWRYGTPRGPLHELTGTWSVRFIDGGPVLPRSFTSDTITPWTGRGDADADRFAGTARYTLTFDAPDTASRHLLTLGTVHESARVRLNGRDLGVVLEPFFSVETGPLRAAANVLEVDVTNLSANRIRDLDRRGVQWRIFHDINVVGIDYKPFDASSWPVRTSGLTGPVTIQPLAGDTIAAAIGGRAIGREELIAIERPRVIAQADRWLREKPVTVTAVRATRSAGGVHDFYSEGDYWWPDPANPKGPYVRRDGETNPANFVAHRDAMRRFSQIVPALVAAYEITRDPRYARHAVEHLRAWFVSESTRMNPSLLYGQAIEGVATGRGIGIIDTIHLVEVAQAMRELERLGAVDAATRDAVHAWFRAYLDWLTTHPYGIAERNNGNNHSAAWALQVAEFATLVGDDTRLAEMRRFFEETLVPVQMAADGSFPKELARTKPYGYSLFQLDVMGMLAEVLSTPSENLWRFTTPDGRGMARALAFMAPYIADKRSWPKPPDVQYFDAWPVRHPALLFGGRALGEPRLVELWRTLDPDPTVDEVIRNYPVRQPLLWVK